MKPKNVMLLGFVNRAVEYLNKHMDEEPDTRLTQLKNIDLASLKDELNDNLDASLGTMQSAMSTLLKAGNEAFDEFIEENLGKESVSEKLNKIFEDNQEIDVKQEELAKLLSFYNLDQDYLNEENIEEDEIVSDEAEEIVTAESIKSHFDKEDEFMDEIRKNATNDDTQDLMPIDHEMPHDENIDSIFSEIVDNESKENNDETISDVEIPRIEELKDSNEVVETRQYVSSLIDDLRAQLIKEEEIKKETETKNKDIYERITKLYPYLPEGFIRSVYELKESLSKEYPLGSKIIILHRVIFNDVENLRTFVEIGLIHEYTINADEKKMIVDIFKEFVNSDGRILTNIYEIANQGYLLDGAYEGYNVILQEE